MLKVQPFRTPNDFSEIIGFWQRQNLPHSPPLRRDSMKTTSYTYAVYSVQLKHRSHLWGI